MNIRFKIYFLEEVLSNDFDFQGGVYNDGGTCAIIVNGNAILFGGDDMEDIMEPRQISVVYRNGIRRINTLPFDFVYGRCHLNNGTVFLCFDGWEQRLCRKRYLHYHN